MAKRKIIRPRHALNDLVRKAGGTPFFSIGDIESLAGVDTRNGNERQALWNQFRDLFTAPSEVLINAVMDHCAALAIQRINAGQLSLVPARY